MKTVIFSCCVLLAALAAGTPRTAGATEVGGRVEILPGWLEALEQRIAAQPNPPPPTSFWQVGNGAASVEPPIVLDAEELGLLVRPVDNRNLDPLPSGGEPEVVVRSAAILPAVTYVAEGMSLLVRNADLFDHELVVEDERGGEPLPMEPLEGGRAFRIRFKARGVFVIRCKLYSFLRGYVVVDSGALRFVRPDAEGAFRFGDLPAGKYSLTVFNATQMAYTAPAPVAGWITGSCSFDVPDAPPPAAAAPAAPSAPAGARGEQPAAATTPAAAPPPPVFQVTVKLGGRGSTESLECAGAWPPPAPAAPTAAGGR